MAETGLTPISRQDAISQGKTTYFTGRVCPHGHISARMVSSKACIQCAQTATKTWKAANREHLAEYAKTYDWEHQERRRERGRANHAKNREKRLAEKRADYQKHKEKRRAAMRRWCANNKERLREINRLKVQKNPEIYRAHKRNRKARVRLALGRHTAADVKEIFRLQRERCALCKKKGALATFHVDHITPISRGGSNDRKNLQVLCPPCNQTKHARDQIEFLRTEKGMLL